MTHTLVERLREVDRLSFSTAAGHAADELDRHHTLAQAAGFTGDDPVGEALKALGADPALVNGAQGRRTSGFDQGESAREGQCECCGRAYRDWVAASPIWNAVIRGGSIDGDEEYNFLCADCFMGLAEDRGIAAVFYVDAKRVKAGLETTTPSGRVWSAAARAWKHRPRRREEADNLLPFFSTDWELLRAVADRFGHKTPQQLASRARDLEERGLVESRWDRCFTIKEWRRCEAIAQNPDDGLDVS